MPGVTEPETGLVFYELSHEWGHGVPTLPGYEDVKLYRSSTHAKNGVMATRIRMVMHSGTHVNAPLHLIQRGAGVGDIALDRFFGFSSAWARYMATGQAISAALNQFRLDWQKSSRKLSADELTRDSIDHLLDLAKTLVRKTDDLVQAETLQWVKEFRETLTEIERSAESQGK